MATAMNTLQRFISALKLMSVEPYLFFINFGYSIRMTTFQSLLMERSCTSLHFYSDDICENLDDHEFQQENSIESANNIYALYMLLASLPAVVVAIFLGPWSDKYSRKYPLIISATGQMLEAAIVSTLAFYPKISPFWYAGSSLFAGFSGGFMLSCSACYSYMSDVTDEKSRSARYAILEFFFITSELLGNILGGQIYKVCNQNPFSVLVLGSCSFAAAALYTIFFVKETIPKAEGIKYSDIMRDLVTVENVKESYRTCSKKRPGNIRLQIWCLVWASFSQKFCELGLLAISFSFARFMFKWDVTEFSYATTTFLVTSAFTTVVIIPILANKLRLHEAALGLIGALSFTAKMTISSVAYIPSLFYYGGICGIFYNAVGIALRARLSKLISKDELGRAFALLATCDSLTPLLGSLVFSQIYNASYSVFPGMVFAAASIFLVPCIIIFGWMMTLPTVSIGDYTREDENIETKPMQIVTSNYGRLEEEL